MSRLTAQELCLYYGQEVKAVWFNRVYGNYKTEIKEVDSYIIQLADDFESLHLMLRPLSDIKEEEMAEWYKLELCTDAEVSDLELERSWTFSIQSWNADSTAYLLSRGFDLFNWIQQGKAIDKTK